MQYRFQFEQWAPFPLAHVFAFFADPNNLPRIMPPASSTQIVSLELKPPRPDLSRSVAVTETLAGPGSKIVTSFRLFSFLPFRKQWIARITEFEWNHHFADTQEKGPFQSWNHRHQFAAVVRNGVSGTIVRDLVEYEIGFGPFGAIAQNLFVARQIQQTFAYRQNILESLLR
jgi:ligand-binding SRPBCC domain-containing protein